MLPGLLSILLILTLWLLVNLLKQLRRILSFSHLPGPPRVSYISGHVMCLLDTMRREGTSYSLRMKWSIQFPDLYLTWIFTTPTVSLTDGNFLHSYFTQPHEKYLYPFLGYCMGNRICGYQSIFNEPGTAVWTKKRRKFRRFFSNFHERSWIEVTEQHTERLVEILKTQTTVVDMEEVTKRVTFDIVCHLGLGSDPNSVTQDSAVRHSLHTMISTGFRRAFYPVRNNIPFLDRDIKQEMFEAVRVSRQYCREILDQRIRRREDRRGGDNHYSSSGSDEDILDIIIACNEGDVEAMIDDVIVFLVAGYDTAANVLAFTIALLLENPQCTDRLVEEVQRADFSSKEWRGDISYLSACISESLRLFPVGPVSHRINTAPIALGRYHIPARCMVQACVYVQHRLPRYWDDPNIFSPERWLTRMSSDHHVTSSNDHVTSTWPATGSYMPYMVGPRNCLGKNLAEVLLRVVLCKLFSKLEFSKADEGLVQAEHCFTLSPKNKVLAMVTERMD